MGDDEALDLARLLDEHVDRAPVGELLHGERRKPLERPLEVERRCEQGGGLVEKGEALAQCLLRHRQVHPLERERGLPRECELERPARRWKLLVGGEGEHQSPDGAVLARERQADEGMTGLRPSCELGIAEVAFRLRAEEDALSCPHRLRERVVAGDREAAERIYEPGVVATRGDHLEPLAVIGQRGDQPAAGVGCAHSLDEQCLEHLLRGPRRDEGVGDELQAEGGVERLNARRGLLLDAEREHAVRLERPRVVRRDEEVVERDDRNHCGDEPGSPPAEGGCGEHREHVEERRHRLVGVAEREQADRSRSAQRDDPGSDGARRRTMQPLGGLSERDGSRAAVHHTSESSRLSCSRSPRATRSSTSCTNPPSSSGSKGFTM
jgi:hypothetical protein